MTSPSELYDAAHHSAKRNYGDKETVLTKDPDRTRSIIDDTIKLGGDFLLEVYLAGFSRVVNSVLDGSFKLRVTSVNDSDGRGLAKVLFTDNVDGMSELFVPSDYHACKVLGLNIDPKTASQVVDRYGRNPPECDDTPFVTPYAGFNIVELGKFRGFSYDRQVPFPRDSRLSEKVTEDLSRFKGFVIARVRDIKAPVLHDIEWAIKGRYHESLRRDEVGLGVTNLKLALEGKEF
jgi:hypothetical protein